MSAAPTPREVAVRIRHGDVETARLARHYRALLVEIAELAAEQYTDRHGYIRVALPPKLAKELRRIARRTGREST